MVQVETICASPLSPPYPKKQPQKWYRIWNLDIFIPKLGLNVASKYHSPGWIYGLSMPLTVPFWGRILPETLIFL